MGSSVLPHALSAVCDEPAIWHPTGQGEAQVHPDVVVERSGGWLTRKNKMGSTHNRTVLPQHLPMFFNLLGRGGAHDVIEPYIPVTSVIGVTGIYDVTFNTPKNANDVQSLNGPDFLLSCGIPNMPLSRRTASPCSTISRFLQASNSWKNCRAVHKFLCGITPRNIPYL